MITVINATNREGNLSQLFSKHIFNELNKSGIKSNYYSLEDLPQNFAFSELYGKRTVEFSQVIEKIIIPSDKLDELAAALKDGFFICYIFRLALNILASSQLNLSPCFSINAFKDSSL